MKSYLRVFKLLWALKRAEHALNDCWLELNSLQRQLASLGRCIKYSGMQAYCEHSSIDEHVETPIHAIVSWDFRALAVGTKKPLYMFEVNASTIVILVPDKYIDVQNAQHNPMMPWLQPVGRISLALLQKSYPYCCETHGPGYKSSSISSQKTPAASIISNKETRNFTSYGWIVEEISLHMVVSSKEYHSCR